MLTSDEIECCNLYWLLVSEYRTESFDLCVVWRPTVRRVRRAFSGPLPSPPRSWQLALGHRLTGSQALPLIARRGALCQEYSQVSLPSHGRPPCPNVGHVGIFHTTRLESSFSSRAGVARQFETDRLPRQFETVERACRSLQAFKMSPSAQGSWHRALFQALQRPSSHPCGSPPG